MLRKSKLWRVACISLSCSVFDLAPALGGDCGSHDYDAGYVVQHPPYPEIVLRYCRGYRWWSLAALGSSAGRDPKTLQAADLLDAPLAVTA
jgi:hypothetical protein